jgi:hypothetical protein
MSKMTLRKRIALTATSALFAGMLSVVVTPTVASAAVGDANFAANAGTLNGSLIVATQDSSAVAGVAHDGTSVSAGNFAAARSKGILVKDSTSGTAQTATLLAGGQLSLYAQVSTTTAFTATAGSFSSAVAGTTGAVTYGSSNASVLFTGATAAAATAVGALWTAPTVAGSYIVRSYVADGAGTAPTLASPAVVLAGQITVTVVAASAGGTYSAAYSFCNTSTLIGDATGVDSTSTVNNGGAWLINFDLDDAYDVSLGSGNIIVSATNGAILALGTSTATGSGGTTSTVVSYGSSQARSVNISQPTAGAPLTTTVTINFGGTVVCTKTVTIKGEVASLVMSGLLTGSLSSSNAGSTWGNADGTGRLGQLGYFAALDSAGNRVDQDALGTVAVDSATITPLITGATLVLGTTDSTTAGTGLGLVAWTCGAVASEAQLKIKFTNTTSGTVISSPAFTARCAGNAYTYKASWDKASYNQGDLAKLTVQFTDSKGNKANSLPAGASIINAPMMTIVTATGSATAHSKADGSVVYTYAVGLPTGITDGTYTSTVDFTALTAVAATVETPTYKVGSGVAAVSNAEVLKSIVALIASINKQIQALQKLILKR